jgi:HK97 family phage prohead protease
VSVELPTGIFVKPVQGDENVFAFQYDFLVEGKALEDGKDSTVTELENGDLLIEGFAAVFEGLDRQNENFTEGAFKRGIKSFLESQASLNFHHKHDHGIGKVLDLQEEEGKGLKMKARVDFQPESSPLRYIYNAIKKGTYKGLSVGGFFKRKLTEAGWRIADMDFTEISVTPVPVHPGTSFAVVAGKALEDIELPAKPEVSGEVRAEDEEMLKYYIEGLSNIFDRISKRGSGQSQSNGGVEASL